MTLDVQVAAENPIVNSLASPFGRAPVVVTCDDSNIKREKYQYIYNPADTNWMSKGVIHASH